MPLTPPLDERTYEDVTVLSVVPAPPGTRIIWEKGNEPEPVYWMALVEIQRRYCTGAPKAGARVGDPTREVRPMSPFDGFLDEIAAYWLGADDDLYPRVLLPNEPAPGAK